MFDVSVDFFLLQVFDLSVYKICMFSVGCLNLPLKMNEFSWSRNYAIVCALVALLHSFSNSGPPNDCLNPITLINGCRAF